jgi:hypothetical protein
LPSTQPRLGLASLGVPTPGGSKDDFLRYLDALGSYIDAGIGDYLRETDIGTYIEAGLDRDVEVRKAVKALRDFAMVDDHPWWEEVSTSHSRSSRGTNPA